ncbi:right-handed parallel beta-helix repeat-containing protein [Streptomyces sp. PDY-4]|uniref:right-handed parallel beta-helix repeat-containing protein n=1 Tax=Streptomyces sp. PDY-4 TaxID=3376070 RepID=UPI003799045D
MVELVADGDGLIPEFYGPDTEPPLERLYVDFGGARVALLPTDIGSRLAEHLSAADPHGTLEASRLELEGQKGTPNGIANLDENAKLLEEQLPDVARMPATVNWINVMAPTYGAKGDGVTDDRAAIQAALDAAYSAGSAVVVFPAGYTFAIADYLHILSGTTVIAYGATIKGIADRGLAKFYRNTDTGFTGYSGHSRIRILGGVWDVNAFDGTEGTVTSVVDAFLLGHNDNVVFDGVTVRNVSGAHAIDIVGSRNVRVLNCQFEGFKDNTPDASSSFREAIQIDFAIQDSGINGSFDGTPCKNVTVQNCFFGASARLGGFGRAVGSHTSKDATTYAEDIKILGNRIESTLQEGVRAYAWKTAIIADNTVSGTGSAGVVITGPDPVAAGYAIACQDITVRGNIFAAAGGSSPLRVIGFATAQPKDIRFVSNSVTASGSTGIYVSYAASPKINDNHVRNCSTSSIYAINCTIPMISGNQCAASGGTSIGVDNCTGGHVSNNVVDGSNGHGVLISGGSNVSVTDNRIVGVVSSGIRATTNTKNARIIGNVILRNGVAAAYGLDVTASATDCLIIDNDLSGSAWPAGTGYRLQGTRQILDWSGSTTTVVPGQNLVS